MCQNVAPDLRRGKQPNRAVERDHASAHLAGNGDRAVQDHDVPAHDPFHNDAPGEDDHFAHGLAPGNDHAPEEDDLIPGTARGRAGRRRVRRRRRRAGGRERGQRGDDREGDREHP